MRLIILFLAILNIATNALGQTTIIPDTNFEKELIILGLDSILDGEVATANIDTVISLYVYSKNISDLTGIEDFASLESLWCEHNNLTFLDISQNSSLTELSVWDNPLTNLDVSQNTNLDFLQCMGNQLTNLDISQNILLKHLNCSYNQLTTLDISHNHILEKLYCNDNSLDSLNVSNNPNLISFYCSRNQIKELNLFPNTQLEILYCGFNEIEHLDVSKNNKLTVLSCGDNNLNCLNVKNNNNHNFTVFYSRYNSNLTCIEADSNFFSSSIIAKIDNQSYFSKNCYNDCSVVGINEASFSNLSLYPNPTSETINVNFGELKHGVNATITNGLGQVILTKFFGTTENLKLEINGPSGIYFLIVTAEQWLYETKKILKK